MLNMHMQLFMAYMIRLGIRVFFWEIAVKIPSQKTHQENLTCDFPEKYSLKNTYITYCQA